jgi:hypothetical protein
VGELHWWSGFAGDSIPDPSELPLIHLYQEEPREIETYDQKKNPEKWSSSLGSQFYASC